MKYLVTGISGFVGGHLVERLCRDPEVGEIVGIDGTKPDFPWLDAPSRSKVRFVQASLLDVEALGTTIREVRPDRIVHLASLSSVAESWKHPVDSFVNNTNIFLNLVETVRLQGLAAKILSVGSSEEYGVVSADDMPLREDHPVNPMSPYAVARVSQEYLSGIYSKGYGIPIVCTRSFNHVGPRQSARFAVSSFVKQAVEAARGMRTAISCGNLSIVRDFIDVRDVVRCYCLLLDKGRGGEIYNVCSGRGHALREVLEAVCRKVGVDVPFASEEGLLRPIDNPVIVGSNEKISKLGMTLEYGLDRSLDDVIRYWSEKVGVG